VDSPSLRQKHLRNSCVNFAERRKSPTLDGVGTKLRTFPSTPAEASRKWLLGVIFPEDTASPSRLRRYVIVTEELARRGWFRGHSRRPQFAVAITSINLHEEQKTQLPHPPRTAPETRRVVTYRTKPAPRRLHTQHCWRHGNKGFSTLRKPSPPTATMRDTCVCHGRHRQCQRLARIRALFFKGMPVSGPQKRKQLGMLAQRHFRSDFHNAKFPRKIFSSRKVRVLPAA